MFSAKLVQYYICQWLKTMLLKHQIKNIYFNQAAILLFFLEYDFNMQLKNVNIHI